ncbi:hypothetical protein [Paenibacillus illinoisensis]|uniref:hypothetical protein n=1 Tax=Paenibacillus illinoisensis TaxID=59845 RepID=UPI00301A0A52
MVKLKMEPFNSMWISCGKNNIISVLMSTNKLWGYLPSVSSAHYAKRSLIPNLALDTDCSEYKKKGWLTLQTHFNLDTNIIDETLDFETHTVTKDVLETIKERISEGYYIFMEVDRYYFPGSIDYFKNHIRHRTLIYGYDDNDKCLFLIEDCVRLGHSDHFLLSYEDFDTVCNDAFTYSKGSIELLCCKVNNIAEDVSPITNDIESKIITNLQHYLKNQKVEYDDIYFDTYGIVAIQEYADSILDIVPFIEDYPILQAVSKMPVDLQKRNLLTIALIDELGKLNNNSIEQLTILYNEIFNNWKLFRNLIFMYVEKKKIKDIKKDYIDKIKILLNELYKKEKYASELFIKYLS